MKELIDFIHKFNGEVGYQAISFRRMKEKGTWYWMIWYGYCGKGEGRMAYWVGTTSAFRTAVTIVKMHRLLSA